MLDMREQVIYFEKVERYSNREKGKDLSKE